MGLMKFRQYHLIVSPYYCHQCESGRCMGGLRMHSLYPPFLRNLVRFLLPFYCMKKTDVRPMAEAKKIQ